MAYYLRDTHFKDIHIKYKMKKKDILENTISISDNVNFRTRNFTKDKRGHLTRRHKNPKHILT